MMKCSMRTLADFHNLHAGSTIVVCGCGESLNELTEPERFITIGVNDVGRKFQPNYLVVVNPRDQFTGDRFTFVENSKADYLFTQLDLGLARESVITFNLGINGGTDLSDPSVLHYTQNSPYVALCLAVHMGASRIGLIGVDFTDDHFFAPTGSHPLAAHLPVIDQQYADLGAAIKARGIEVVNLSATSRLTAFPKQSLEEFTHSTKKIFFINYKFLSCGEVFTDGLHNAATSLSLNFQEAYWDDPELATKIDDFAPDWLFVVHGRRFIEKWRGSFPSIKKAVWLLDEPYEVDDTSRWSSEFDVVFVNDPNTVDRHRNAHYLPVAYDPEVHFENGNTRKYDVGFIGGHNDVRERYLLALHEAGFLSYVVGGPWRSTALQSICLAPNIAATETSDLYRQTRIVLNVFREIHHYNRDGVKPYSLNPRVYEAIACGAVVVSEARGEVSELFPELPLFEDSKQLLDKIGALQNDDEAYARVKRVCRERVQAHSYKERLRRVLDMLGFDHKEVEMKKASPLSLKGWKRAGKAARQLKSGELVFNKSVDEGPATEQGLASELAYRNVELSFEVKLERDACFIAKVRQASQHDQATNSYHLYCHPSYSYLARHNHAFQHVAVKREQWQQIKLRVFENQLELELDGVPVVSVVDNQLDRGYCFVGCKNGKAVVRNLAVRELSAATVHEQAPAITNGLPKFRTLLETERQQTPAVSIITTIYDRVNLLAGCLQTVRELVYRDFEHIIVSDHPPEEVVSSIESMVSNEPTPSLTYADLDARTNNWGITPASVGLHLARGRYVCFLSDDNGYTPDHFDPLVSVLEEHSDIAFVYSSCQYAGRLVLRNSTPLPGGIDLGQPLFRKEIFDRYLPGPLPFDMMAWDWHMIETFMQHGLRWLHVDRPTFLFRLAACAQRELIL